VFALCKKKASLRNEYARVGNSSGDENGSDPMKLYWEIIADNLSKEWTEHRRRQP
jgi:hypothetical protein